MFFLSFYLCVCLYLFLLTFTSAGSPGAEPTSLGANEMPDGRVRCTTRGFIKSRCAGGLSSALRRFDALPKSSLVSREAQGEIGIVLVLPFRANHKTRHFFLI